MLEALRREIAAVADPEVAHFQARYFKSGPGDYGEGDQFLGIRVPVLRRLARQYRAMPQEEVLTLLVSPWHEERLLALLIWVEQYRRASEPERQVIFDSYLAHTRFVNNWDLVDSSAEHLVGAHLDPAEAMPLLEQLAHSDMLWERRIAIMATFHWIRRGIFQPTLHLARLLLHDRHDLIHKAVGWMLREVGKRDLPAEETFLQEHYHTMPRTMLRYAIEHFPLERRQAYLRGEI